MVSESFGVTSKDKTESESPTRVVNQGEIGSNSKVDGHGQTDGQTDCGCHSYGTCPCQSQPKHNHIPKSNDILANCVY